MHHTQRPHTPYAEDTSVRLVRPWRLPLGWMGCVPLAQSFSVDGVSSRPSACPMLAACRCSREGKPKKTKHKAKHKADHSKDVHSYGPAAVMAGDTCIDKQHTSREGAAQGGKGPCGAATPAALTQLSAPQRQQQRQQQQQLAPEEVSLPDAMGALQVRAGARKP